MNQVLLDDIDDEPTPFRVKIGRRQAPRRAPVREIVATESEPAPEPMTPLDRAVMCNAYGGIWLKVLPDEVDDVVGLVVSGIAHFAASATLFQLTVKGAREMGLLPVTAGEGK